MPTTFGKIAAPSRCRPGRKAKGQSPLHGIALDPAKVLSPGSRSRGCPQQLASLTSWGSARPQGVGSRPHNLSWHLQGGGGRKCPAGMAQLRLFWWDLSWPTRARRPGRLTSGLPRGWGRKLILGRTYYVLGAPLKSVQERGGGNNQLISKRKGAKLLLVFLHADPPIQSFGK